LSHELIALLALQAREVDLRDGDAEHTEQYDRGSDDRQQHPLTQRPCGLMSADAMTSE
jgi:hypothetical protein